MHASTNLSTRALSSTDLPARSPTHVIQQLQTSPLATTLKCEHGTYEPSHSYPHREHHNMNLPAHIITCSPLTMNLPAHDIVKNLLV